MSNSNSTNSELKQLKTSDIKSLRTEILKEQNYKCAICGKKLTVEDSVLDHSHKYSKSDIIGQDGRGLIRGVLCNACNLIEGKTANAITRYHGKLTVEERIKFLENLITYYRQGTKPYIHPTEAVPQKNLSKKNFNKLNKQYVLKYNRKPLEYPKSKKMTKQLEKLFHEFEINPYN